MATSKKDYVAIAKAFASTRPVVGTVAYAVWLDTLVEVSAVFKASSPRFDYDRFTKACKEG